MGSWFRNLVAILLPWYHAEEERERDVHTERVHNRAERAIDEANYLIDSYVQADKILRKHKRIWRLNGN